MDGQMKVSGYFAGRGEAVQLLYDETVSQSRRFVTELLDSRIKMLKPNECIELLDVDEDALEAEGPNGYKVTVLTKKGVVINFDPKTDKLAGQKNYLSPADYASRLDLHALRLVIGNSLGDIDVMGVADYTCKGDIILVEGHTITCDNDM